MFVPNNNVETPPCFIVSAAIDLTARHKPKIKQIVKFWATFF